MNKILIIEDDPKIVKGLETAFKFHEFTVLHANNAEGGLSIFQKNQPDLVILDIMLPGLDGFEICKRVKKENPLIPVIMLTAKSQESDKLLGFELGIDDYITKPFSAKELIARVKAVLKRSNMNHRIHKAITIGNVSVNFESFLVIKGESEIPLSPKERAILKLFTTFPNRVISRSQIIDEVWGDDYFPSPKTIDNFIVKLRSKIEDNPKKPQHLLTIHGAGYKFKF